MILNQDMLIDTKSSFLDILSHKTMINPIVS